LPYGPKTYNRMTGPAATLEEMQSYNRTVQYGAEEGCYVNIRMEHGENKFSRPTNQYHLFQNSDDLVRVPIDYDPTADQCNAVTGVGVVSEQLTANSDDVGYGEYMAPFLIPPPKNQTTPAHVTTAAFTGLNGNSTFTIRAVWYVELSPPYNDSQYRMLTYSAKPSPSIDAKALQLYDIISQRMPVGCPQRMNDFGDWWVAIRDAICSVARPITSVLSYIPGPIGTVASIAGKVVDVVQKIGPTKAERKQQQQSRQRALTAPTLRHPPKAAVAGAMRGPRAGSGVVKR
jgi:hypothetical protein